MSEVCSGIVTRTLHDVVELFPFLPDMFNAILSTATKFLFPVRRRLSSDPSHTAASSALPLMSVPTENTSPLHHRLLSGSPVPHVVPEPSCPTEACLSATWAWSPACSDPPNEQTATGYGLNCQPGGGFGPFDTPDGSCWCTESCFYALQAVKEACQQTNDLELVERNCAFNEGNPPDGKWHEIPFTIMGLHVRNDPPAVSFYSIADAPLVNGGVFILILGISFYLYGRRRALAGSPQALM
eukprot:6841989-Prymnesium_polylepis.1